MFLDEIIFTNQRMLWSEGSSIYTENQQIVLAVLPIFSGFLSILASTALIYIIFTDEKRSRNREQRGHKANMTNNQSSKYHGYSSYQRIMIGLSVSDILNSIRATTSTFVMPSDTIGVWQPHGNTTTCTIQGFFAQLGMAAMLYNASLAVSFAVSVHPHISEEKIRTLIEPVLHTVPIVFSLSTAITGIFLKVYNPLPLGIGCWVAAYPLGCLDKDNGINCTRGENADTIMWIFGGAVTAISFIIILLSMAFIYFSVKNQLCKMQLRYGIASIANKDLTNITATSNVRLKSISNQASLYVSIFFLTYIWSSIGRLMESKSNFNFGFFISILSQIFYPLQGFLNLIIFIRPRYLRIRKNNKNISYFRAIVRALGFDIDSKDPQTEQMEAASSEKYVISKTEEFKSEMMGCDKEYLYYCGSKMENRKTLIEPDLEKIESKSISSNDTKGCDKDHNTVDQENQVSSAYCHNVDVNLDLSS